MLKPTNRLRWVKRENRNGETEHGDTVYLDFVLQQLWEDPEFPTLEFKTLKEWRDIPVETE